MKTGSFLTFSIDMIKNQRNEAYLMNKLTFEFYIKKCQQIRTRQWDIS